MSTILFVAALVTLSCIIVIACTSMFDGKPYYHEFKKGRWITTFPHLELMFHHSSNVETFEEAEACFEDLLGRSHYAVIGTCFHLMQQLGGTLMYRKYHVRAAVIEDCSGEVLHQRTIVNLKSAMGLKSVYLEELLLGENL